MLLVVDDVWNAAHADWFRVGGVGCRVLVTTREARIEGAEVYPLALMSEEEAIDLVRRKLGRSWKVADEGEVRSFAKVLGYLPLALDLAANQVRDGLSWGELRSEFEVERRAVALEILDAAEAWERLSEEEQRKYSLRACFNLSLKRLSAVQLRQFAWLGVLPEDVDLSGTIAEVLWDVKPIWAKRGLSDLRNRSFLTDGVQTFEGVATYRVHDLMHDTARGLIEKGELGIESLEMAHGAFLERYRGRSVDGSWYGLANDGYIHRHLTWHLEMAGQLDAVHELMAAGEDQNDWFEACDKIGQPGIFVEDVRRGWRLAEELYDRDRGRAIVLQCRYALITGTLNNLVGNLTGELLAVFVDVGYWSVERAWGYVEQMVDDEQIGNSIQALAPYFSPSLVHQALKMARSIQDEARAIALIGLTKINIDYFHEALDSVQKIKYEDNKAGALNKLIKVACTRASELFSVAQSIRDEGRYARILSNLAIIDLIYFKDAFKLAFEIQNDFWCGEVLFNLSSIKQADFDLLLEASQSVHNEYCRSGILMNLCQNENADFSSLLKMSVVLKRKG